MLTRPTQPHSTLYGGPGVARLKKGESLGQSLFTMMAVEVAIS
jgi:hypothetical protein